MGVRNVRKISTLVVVLIVALVVPAVAAATCDMSSRESDPGQYGVTYDIQDGGGTGYYSYIKSNIIVKDPVLAPNCASYICLSYSYIMMAGSGSGTWAQWGPGEGYLDGYNHAAGTAFVQCYGPSGLYDDDPTVSSVGSNPLYTIHYGTDPLLQSGNKIELINSTIYDWCGGGGLNAFTFTPTRAQDGIEIADQKTQVPGTVPNHETFSNTVAIDPTTGSRNFFTGGSWGWVDGDPQSFVGLNVVNSSTLDEWDKDCGS